MLFELVSSKYYRSIKLSNAYFINNKYINFLADIISITYFYFYFQFLFSNILENCCMTKKCHMQLNLVLSLLPLCWRQFILLACSYWNCFQLMRMMRGVRKRGVFPDIGHSQHKLDNDKDIP